MVRMAKIYDENGEFFLPWRKSRKKWRLAITGRTFRNNSGKVCMQSGRFPKYPPSRNILQQFCWTFYNTWLRNLDIFNVWMW